MPLRKPGRAVRLTRAVAGAALVLLALAPAAPVAADGGLTMTARALLQGHARQGAWMAVAVDVENAGPTVTGELRVTGGPDMRTRFGLGVELATGSRKTFTLYVQPPGFVGSTSPLVVELVAGGSTVATAKAAVALHDPNQLVVGILAENPARIVSQVSLLPNAATGTTAVLVPLVVADLPDRVQGWAGLDRLIWQDTDAASLSTEQLTALSRWVAAGGRLVIVGGTAGPDALNALPEELLPYRPSGVLDVDPALLRPILGALPKDAAPVAALVGSPGKGRPLATSGDRVVAADMPYGSGHVTLLGFNPLSSWMTADSAMETLLWRRLVPQRSGTLVALTDDSQLVSGAASLPSLSLPPTSGLLVLIFGYILLIGPVNYLVLRRLDRREWAWATVPALIVVFTVGAFGIGALTRGSSVIVHEVAIVRGAPGTDLASAQSWLGIFSPTRASFAITVPGDTLIAGPISGDMFSTGATSPLDVLEGNPTKVRDLGVGYGSLRTIRAEGSATGPVVEATLTLVDSRLTGTVTNRSPMTLLAPALVLGSSVVTFPDLAPGATATISLPLAGVAFNQVQLSDKVVGQVNWGASGMDEATQRRMVRRAVIDQLTMDPMTGIGWSLPAGSAVLLAWGSDPVIPAVIEGQQVRRVTDVLYQIPFRYSINGKVSFSGDLLPPTMVSNDSSFFSKDPWSMGFGTGTIEMDYRPVAFDGTFTASEILVAMTNGGDPTMPGGSPLDAKPEVRCEITAADCSRVQDGIPELDVFDVRTGAWVQFAHLALGQSFRLPDPGRWLDPVTGDLRVRFVNERPEQVYFQFRAVISGSVK